MADIHVTGVPRVNIRCQFETIPGVTHIVLEFDPYSRGNRVAGKIESGYGDFPLNDQVINNCLRRDQSGALFILKKDTFQEIAEAVEKGFKVLRDMVKASGYNENYF